MTNVDERIEVLDRKEQTLDRIDEAIGKINTILHLHREQTREAQRLAVKCDRLTEALKRIATFEATPHLLLTEDLIGTIEELQEIARAALKDETGE